MDAEDGAKRSGREELEVLIKKGVRFQVSGVSARGLPNPRLTAKPKTYRLLCVLKPGT